MLVGPGTGQHTRYRSKQQVNVRIFSRFHLVADISTYRMGRSGCYRHGSIQWNWPMESTWKISLLNISSAVPLGTANRLLLPPLSPSIQPQPAVPISAEYRMRNSRCPRRLPPLCLCPSKGSTFPFDFFSACPTSSDLICDTQLHGYLIRCSIIQQFQYKESQ